VVTVDLPGRTSEAARRNALVDRARADIPDTLHGVE
jgi:hypothetical protein